MNYKTNQDNIDLNKYYFDEKAADSAVRYIESRIRHVKGKLAGELLVLEEWQKDEIVRPIFGWKHIDTGLRKYTSAYIEIPKKSGKSFLAASFAAIFLDIEEEGGSEIIGVAWGRKQAGLVFEATKEVIKKSPELKSKCTIYRNSITAPDHLGGTKTYHILSKEAGSEDGINPQLAIIDELHVHKNNEVLEMVEKSMGAREQPLSFVITTAGSDLYGIGYQRHEYAIDVAKGVIEDEATLVLIYAADDSDDEKYLYSEKTHKKVNPNYGVSIGKRAYEKEALKARQNAPELNSFKRYYLNIWVSNLVGWMNMSKWNNSHWEIKKDFLKGKPCYAAIDLSSRSDITALTLMFRVDQIYYSLNWFWLPEEKGLNSADKNNSRYLQWVKDGFIEETPGDMVDYVLIRRRINEIARDYNIKFIAYDDWNSHQIAPQLEEDKFNLIEFRQGFKSMSSPTKDLESYATSKSKKFNHLGNPVLTWMAGNAEVRVDDAANWKIVKNKKQPEKKVDGVITNVMSLQLWIEPPPDTGSYLESGELYIIKK